MAEANAKLSIFITGGSESAGLATARACLAAGHKVTATARDADGALAIRQAGALPVYPDLSRASAVYSTLMMAKADALIHAAPQTLGGVPHGDVDYEAEGAELERIARSVVSAAQGAGVKRLIGISFGCLYAGDHGAAKEGSHDAHGADYAAMLSAEKALLDANMDGFVLRAGYIYGGKSPATSQLAAAIKRSEALPDGSQPASWIHEDDLAAAIVALLEADSDGMRLLNAASDMPCSPNDFAIALSESLGLAAPDFTTGGPFAFLRRQPCATSCWLAQR